MFIDCHQDIAYSILSNKRDFKTKSEKYMITFDNLKDSNLDIIFSTIFVSHRREEKHKEEASLQIEEYNKIFQNFPDDFYHIQNKDELRQPKGKIGLIFLMEGAEPISSVDDVDLFYELGLRILGLTWNNENKYAFGSDKDGSLKTEGYELIEKMNEKDITLDLSHLSEKSFWDCIEKTNLIPIASHSNSSKIRKHKRNLNDEQLVAISDKGGITGLVLYNQFIASKQKIGMDEVYKQFLHLLNTCGEDHISIGSDIDGAPIEDFPEGIKKASDLQKIITLLESKRIKTSIIEKFSGKNALRVLNENLV